tara:strand:+ start:176 stop:823 length:648 start_codon:yes stop_codon:yes gene_type:complete
MIKISPSILNVKENDLENKVKSLDNSGADYIHIDVMDGHYVDNTSFGVETIKKIRKITSKILDVHLMVRPVQHHIDDYIEAGSDIISFHPEADENSVDIIKHINQSEVKSGIAIHPEINIEKFEYLLPLVKQVIVMTVIPGFGGQKFMENQVYKIGKLNQIRKNKNYKYKIEVDGGINNTNKDSCINNGVDILAVGSYLLSKDKTEYKDIINSLR